MITGQSAPITATLAGVRMSAVGQSRPNALHRNVAPLNAKRTASALPAMLQAPRAGGHRTHLPNLLGQQSRHQKMTHRA